MFPGEEDCDAHLRRCFLWREHGVAADTSGSFAEVRVHLAELRPCSLGVVPGDSVGLFFSRRSFDDDVGSGTSRLEAKLALNVMERSCEIGIAILGAERSCESGMRSSTAGILLSQTPARRVHQSFGQCHPTQDWSRLLIVRISEGDSRPEGLPHRNEGVRIADEIPTPEPRGCDKRSDDCSGLEQLPLQSLRLA